ncbi:iron ABC transporter ATP-binding protein [Enterococcus sp. RIT-PI-f]|jgi:iron complex transport system ATP-binding protein|uniref:iron ABC transporter ATP-binding protein n=2 Tax=unclassified Enterococcus TaxID=2608891 RepID=UPI0006B93140|nr:ATP-binding cassette domain-containing protein [Enterococcus sp. RIT-PI-f]KPG73268.1 iron ABC transporter ATP-binding protein [Enterococcus sp. RIT-PI-f]
MIETVNLHQSYGKTPIIKACDLTLPEGQLIALIGPNGAGKSTLLSLLSRVLNERTGAIYLDGRELKQWPGKELARKLAYLQQSNQYGVHLTVEELVAFGRYPYNRGRQTVADEQIIASAIHKVGLADFKERSIHALSGGQLQRVYLAMVLAQETDYILLDEPLNNLDLKHATQLMNHLTELVQSEKKTVVIVLHDINYAARYADYIVAMKDGQVLRAGSTKEIIQESLLSELYELPIKLVPVEGSYFCYPFT